MDEEISKFKTQKQELSEKIKELIMKEDISKGIIYAKEIYELTQQKHILEVEIEYREKKKMRLMWHG